MKKMMKKSSSSSSSKHYLPVEIVTNIINKVLDLKTLCVCKGVSKGFLEIASQVDTIVYTCDDQSDNFKLAMKSLLKFASLKFLHIVLPLPSRLDDPFLLYKWQMTYGTSYDSFVFMSAVSMNETADSQVINDEEKEQDNKDNFDRCKLGKKCQKFAVDSFKNVWRYLNKVDKLPLLQLISIKDSANTGRIIAKNISQLRRNLKCIDDAGRILEEHSIYAYLPSLKLPVSGYVMEEVTMIMDGDIEYGNHVDEDEEEKIYKEAIKEMWEKAADNFEYIELAFERYYY